MAQKLETKDHVDFKWLWFFGIVIVLLSISLNVEKMVIWVFGVTIILAVFLLELIEKKAQKKRKEIEEKAVDVFKPIRFTLDETQKRIKINSESWSPWVIAPEGKQYIKLSFPSWAKIMYLVGIEEELKKDALIYTDIPHRIFRFCGEDEVVVTVQKKSIVEGET